MDTLSSFLEKNQTSESLISLIIALSETCVDIAKLLKHGPMNGILGMAGAENVQGEDQKKLDVISNDIIKDKLLKLSSVRGLASEEEETIVECNKSGEYLVSFDPLDGSSNIDINSLVGTIFSVYRTNQPSTLSESDFLKPGKEQVCSMYVLYGPSAILTLTTGNGTHMFMLDLDNNEFVLYKENVKISENTKEFAINMSNQRHWAAPMQNYVNDLLKGETGRRGKNFNMRWVAAMVGDVHRVLTRSGIFMYPWDKRKPDQAGKLRLMYEANPMSFIVEQAGGKAWSDKERILDIQPIEIHQRVPVILGSAEEVDVCLSHHLE